MKKKFLILIFAFIISNLCFASEADCQSELANWKLKSEFIQPLIPSANSEDLGQVVYRTYERESPRGVLEIIWTEGKGTENLYIPANVDDSKKLFPGAEYKILEIENHKAILENQSDSRSPTHLPLALAIQVDDNVILNLESSSLNQEELISIAKEILSSWNFTKSD
ncbi:MAG: hypothetical protein IJS40_06560 [Synergistaceae bacterium]|nr:hypothetical protein [Synergistaceae bacterium]